jgi:glycosyltransferase involved in cell wall biosynthesis
MRIGIDVRLWQETGVGRYTRNLVKHLQEIDKKNEYILFALNKDRENIKLEISNPRFQVKTADIRWHTFAEQTKLPPILNKEQLDLMHFPYFSVPFLYKKPFVVTIHDLILHHFPTGEASTLPFPFYYVKLLAYKWLIKQAALRAKKILTVSFATKHEINTHLGIKNEKIVVAHEGIDDALVNKQKASVVIKGVYFLYVGNAYPHKNLKTLIDAFVIARSGYTDMKLVLVGKNDYFYERLQEYTKKQNLGSSVMFYGHARDYELRSLYANAKALVLPSKMEGFGLPMLEAMSEGCVVIASDIPVFHEIGDTAPLYVDSSDPRDIATSMHHILFNDDVVKSKKEKGLVRSKLFSWKALANSTLKTYESSTGV